VSSGEARSEDANGRKAEVSVRGAHVGTGNQSTEQLQLSCADVTVGRVSMVTGNCTVFATEFYAPCEHARVLNTKLCCEDTEKHAHAQTAHKISCKDSAISCKNDVAVSETTGAQKIYPSVDLTASCSTASPPAKRLKVFDAERIIMGDEMQDSKINHAQRLHQARYPRVNGFRLTLYKGKLSDVENSVQIVHCLARHHWITTITLNCKAGEVKIFDSSFTYCDKETEGIICNFYQQNKEKLTITMSRSQKQSGEKDCGVFAIAFAVALVFKL